MYHSLCIGGIPVCRCIVSALILTSVTMVGWADIPDSDRVTSDVGVPSTYLVNTTLSIITHLFVLNYRESVTETVEGYQSGNICEAVSLLLHEQFPSKYTQYLSYNSPIRSGYG